MPSFTTQNVDNPLCWQMFYPGQWHTECDNLSQTEVVKMPLSIAITKVQQSLNCDNRWFVNIIDFVTITKLGTDLKKTTPSQTKNGSSILLLTSYMEHGVALKHNPTHTFKHTQPNTYGVQRCDDSSFTTVPKMEMFYALECCKPHNP